MLNKIMHAVTDVMMHDMRGWFKDCTVSDINGGDCYNWAMMVYTLYPECSLVTCCHRGGHAWVYYDGKHYDAECMNGVVNWRDLPCFEGKAKRDHEDWIEFQDSDEFRAYWKIGKRSLNKKIRSTKNILDESINSL